MFTDSHAHIDETFFESGLDQVVERFRAAGVDRVVTVGSSGDATVIEAALRTAERYPEVVAVVGVHPHDGDRLDAQLLDRLALMAKNPVVRGIGETGLDFHYDLSSRRGQMEAFSQQLNLAAGLNLPVVIHCREAHRECIDIVRSEWPAGRQGQIHCFTGNADEVVQWLDLGFLVSIPGVVTFRNAAALADAVKIVPDNMLLIETDSPYLAPVPMRGRPNEPSFLPYTAAAVARLRNATVEHVAEVTSRNAAGLFNLF